VEKNLKKYKGRYKEMFQALDAKYNRVKSVSAHTNLQVWFKYSVWPILDRA